MGTVVVETIIDEAEDIPRKQSRCLELAHKIVNVRGENYRRFGWQHNINSGCGCRMAAYIWVPLHHFPAKTANFRQGLFPPPEIPSYGASYVFCPKQWIIYDNMIVYQNGFL